MFNIIIQHIDNVSMIRNPQMLHRWLYSTWKFLYKYSYISFVWLSILFLNARIKDTCRTNKRKLVNITQLLLSKSYYIILPYKHKMKRNIRGRLTSSAKYKQVSKLAQNKSIATTSEKLISSDPSSKLTGRRIVEIDFLAKKDVLLGLSK